MKILITNIVALNAGDAAILNAMMNQLRAAFGDDTKFIVYDSYGEGVSRYYPDVTFRKLLYFNFGSYRIKLLGRKLRSARLFAAVDRARFHFGLWCLKHNLQFITENVLTKVELRDVIEYNSADLIISSGGTYLVENYSLSHRLFDYKLSQYLGRPLIFFTQSLGPFSTPSTRRTLARVFNNSILILVRDRQSFDNLIDLGVKNSNIHIAADAAFALSDPVAIEAAKNERRNLDGPLKIAISVREWRHFKAIDPTGGMHRYQEALRALTVHLVERYNAKITYLSTCQGMPEYWTDDSKIAWRVVESLPEGIKGSVIVDSDFHHPVDLAEMLKGYDLVIATRMHMAILALGAGIPVVPIAYEFKMHELFKRLGHGRWVQNIESINGESLIEAVDSFLDSMPQIRGTLFTAVQKERESALESAGLVKKAFNQWQQSKRLRKDLRSRQRVEA